MTRKIDLKERLKYGPYLSTYNKDYISRKPYELSQYRTVQEFVDPIREGFRHYLKLAELGVKPPKENADEYLEKFKCKEPKIAKIYFENPLDHMIIRGEQLLTGKTEYQVDYCDIEADIKRKLRDANKKNIELPEDWEIPITTHKTHFRPPLLLSQHAMDPPLIVKQPDNLGQNEHVNEILNVRTGDSEYNNTYGKVGEFIVTHQIHGKIEKVDLENII